MSFSIFKQNMLIYMQNQNGIRTLTDFGKKLTQEYDMAVRRGYQTINKASVQKPNVDLMEKMVNLAGMMALQKRSGQHDILNNIGKGVEMYWMGATLYQFPIPIIPAIGSYQNIMTTSAQVTDPGKFPDMKLQFPINDIGQYLDMMIMGMTMHLLTIKGIYNTVSLYPGFPAVPPAPGILQWQGYTIPPASRSPSVKSPPVDQDTDTEELLKSVPNDNVTVEGARKVVAQTGINILDDDVDDGGPTIKAIKRSLPPDNPPFKESETPKTVAPEPENTEKNKDVSCGSSFTGSPADYNSNLSANYKVRHLSIQTTFPHKIKAQHGLSQEDIVCNLKSLAENILEPIRSKYPGLIINSAYRGRPSIPGKVSQHEKGEAVDIQFKGMSPLEYLPIARWIAGVLPIDQLIFEHGNSIWLHISNRRDGKNRKQTLTMYKGKYTPGIKCHYS